MFLIRQKYGDRQIKNYFRLAADSLPSTGMGPALKDFLPWHGSLAKAPEPGLVRKSVNINHKDWKSGEKNVNKDGQEIRQ